MADTIQPDDVPILVSQSKEYLALGRQIDTLTKRRDGVKAALLNYVTEQGVPDEGHMFVELPEVIDGVYGWQRQRRITRRLDEEAADLLLDERALRERCTTTVEVIDQDEIYACLADGTLSADDVDLMFPAKESFAFVAKKVK